LDRKGGNSFLAKNEEKGGRPRGGGLGRMDGAE